MNIPKYAPIRQRDINYLLQGVDIFYPQYSRIPKTPQEIEEFKSLYQGINKDQFETVLFSFTEQKTAEAAISFLYEISENPEVGYTIPVNIQELVDIKFAPPSEYAEVREKNAKAVSESIKRSQEIRTEREKSPRTRTIPFDPDKAKAGVENVYIKAIGKEATIDLTAKENQELRNVIRLVKQDPKKFHDEAVKRTQEVLINKAQMSPEAAAETAEAYTNNFIVAVSSVNPNSKAVTIDNSRFEIKAALADVKNTKDIFLDPEQAVAFSELMSAEYYRDLSDAVNISHVLSNSLGVDVSSFYIPSNNRSTSVATVDLGKSSAQISVKGLMDELSQIKTTQKAVLKAVWEENKDIYDQSTKQEKIKVDQEAKRIAEKMQSKRKAFEFLRFRKFKGLPPTKDFNIDYFTQKVPKSNLPKLPQAFSSVTAMPFSVGGLSTSNSLLSPLFNAALHSSISRLPQVAALKRIVTGYGAKIVAKAAAKGVLGKAIAAIAARLFGLAGGPPGWIATAVLIIGSKIKTFLQRHGKRLPYIIGGLFLGSYLLTGSSVLLVPVAGSALVVGIGPFVSFIGGALMALTGIVVGSILVPMLIILIGIPIAVAIIIYIINTSAYLVPPSSNFAGAGSVVSPYIKVTKIASSETHPDKGSSVQLEFENTDLPLEITYTITITALKGTLTHVEIREVCSVIKEFSPPACPTITPALPSSIPDISPASPYAFTYKRSFYAPQFNDTLTIDTITVTADTPDASGVSSSGSASVKIGEPPEDCPFGWPILPEGGESSLPIIQGPLTSGSDTTHDVVEAIDVKASSGHNVTARHTGVATERTSWGNYGDMVEIASTCVLSDGRSVNFVSRYGHLSVISINTGQIVHMGQSIGASGSTGTNNEHLHYEFSPRNTVPMDQPYIPKHVDYGCADWMPLNRCDVTIP